MVFGTTGPNVSFCPPSSVQVLNFYTAKCWWFHDDDAGPTQGGCVDSAFWYAKGIAGMTSFGGTGLSATVASIIKHESLMWECILSSSHTVVNHLLQN